MPESHQRLRMCRSGHVYRCFDQLEVRLNEIGKLLRSDWSRLWQIDRDSSFRGLSPLV